MNSPSRPPEPSPALPSPPQPAHCCTTAQRPQVQLMVSSCRALTSLHTAHDATRCVCGATRLTRSEVHLAALLLVLVLAAGAQVLRGCLRPAWPDWGARNSIVRGCGTKRTIGRRAWPLWIVRGRGSLLLRAGNTACGLADELGRLWLRSLVMHRPVLLHDPGVRALAWRWLRAVPKRDRAGSAHEYE